MLYFNQQLIHGEGQHAGLCTLWTPKERYASLRPCFSVIGNLYSPFGVGVMIRNALADHTLTDILITGTENPDPAMRRTDALLAGDINLVETRLEMPHAEAFKRWVRLHDLRHLRPSQPEAIRAYVEGLGPGLRGASDRIEVPIELGSADGSYPTRPMGHPISSTSMEDAWFRGLREIRMFGDRTEPDREGHYRQELRYVVVTLPPDSYRGGFGGVTEEQGIAYGDALWEGNEPGDLTYRYGHTMRYRYGDQIEEVRRILRGKSASFRPYISLWEPLKSMQRDDEPCLVAVQPMLRENRLDMAATFRTHDMFRGWPLNVIGLGRFQNQLAWSLGARPGGLVVISGSAHLYSYDIPSVDETLVGYKGWNRLQFDPKGNWRIDRSEAGYEAELYHEGRLVQSFRDKSKEGLKRQILPFISDASHGVYIGETLAALP